MVKVYVEDSQMAMEEVFEQLGWEIVPSIAPADVVVLIGGADIATEWYNALYRHPMTRGSQAYDMTTHNDYKEALSYGKAIIGVCRGAQFINAMVGGDMYQHVTGHTYGRHLVWDLISKSYHTVNSIHHQMMIPTKEAVLIAKASPRYPDPSVLGRREVFDERGELYHLAVSEEAPEWEVLYYPKVRGLCFQAHPEYDAAGGSCREYFYDLLRRYYPELFKE